MILPFNKPSDKELEPARGRGRAVVLLPYFAAEKQTTHFKVSYPR